MSITIVSALPKSAPAPAADASASAENAGAAPDFASLLLGQLAEALPIGGKALAAAIDPAIDEAGEQETDDLGAATPNDPLALLAALAQAPVEQRSDIGSGTAPIAPDSLSAMVAESQVDAVPATLTDRTASTMESEFSQQLPTPEAGEPSDPAAKIAVPSFAAASDGIPANPQKNETLLATTNDTPQPTAIVAHPASLHANRNDSATLSVPTPLRDRDWNNDFAQKVVWVATSHKQAAELTLNPPTMGSIEISLKIDSDRSTATATFVSANAEVRETIETALPRLREMFAGIGIELGQANVSAESFRQASGNESNAGSASHSGNDKAILGLDAQASPTGSRNTVHMGRGLVDTFA